MKEYCSSIKAFKSGEKSAGLAVFYELGKAPIFFPNSRALAKFYFNRTYFNCILATTSHKYMREKHKQKLE